MKGGENVMTEKTPNPKEPGVRYMTKREILAANRRGERPDQFGPIVIIPESKKKQQRDEPIIIPSGSDGVRVRLPGSWEY